MFEADIYITYKDKELLVTFIYLKESVKDLRKNVKIIKIIDISGDVPYTPKNRRVRNAIKEMLLKKINII